MITCTETSDTDWRDQGVDPTPHCEAVYRDSAHPEWPEVLFRRVFPRALGDAALLRARHRARADGLASARKILTDAALEEAHRPREAAHGR
jgi:hypothetical protein